MHSTTIAIVLLLPGSVCVVIYLNEATLGRGTRFARA